MTKKPRLEFTLRPRGRPRKGTLTATEKVRVPFPLLPTKIFFCLGIHEKATFEKQGFSKAALEQQGKT